MPRRRVQVHFHIRGHCKGLVLAISSPRSHASERRRVAGSKGRIRPPIPVTKLTEPQGIEVIR